MPWWILLLALQDRQLQDLDDDSPQIREQATAELIRMGPKIAPLLAEKIRGETDPERKTRLEFIRDEIDRIEAWRGVDESLAKIAQESDRARVRHQLSSGKPDEVLQGVVAIAGWLVWESFHEKPKARVGHAMSDADIERVFRFVLRRHVRGEKWREVARNIFAWAYPHKAVGMAPEMTLLLKDPFFEFRVAACTFLGHFNQKDSIGLIEPLLDDPHVHVYGAASRALIELESAWHLREIFLRLEKKGPLYLTEPIGRRLGVFEPKLAELLADADRGVQLEALKTLDALDRAGEHSAALVELLRFPHEIANLAERVLIEIPAVDRAEALAKLLQDPGENARFHAARVLGQFRLEGFEKRLAPLLKDENAQVRLAALEGLGDPRGREFASEVAAFLKSARTAERQHAATALGRMGLAARADDVASLLKDSDGSVRIYAAFALARLGDRRCLPAIGELLRSNKPESSMLQSEAIVLLNGVRSPKAYQKLAGLRIDRPIKRRHVMDALNAIGAKSGLPVSASDRMRFIAEHAYWNCLRPGSCTDLLDQMRYWSGGAFFLEEKEIRVEFREETIKFWIDWIASTQR